jgi:hypothetical protein
VSLLRRFQCLGFSVVRQTYQLLAQWKCQLDLLSNLDVNASPVRCFSNKRCGPEEAASKLCIRRVNEKLLGVPVTVCGHYSAGGDPGSAPDSGISKLCSTGPYRRRRDAIGGVRFHAAISSLRSCIIVPLRLNHWTDFTAPINCLALGP